MPDAVARELGPSPLVVQIRGSLLALLAPPAIGRLQALESAIAAEPRVRAEYGPTSWLRTQLTALGRRIARAAAGGIAPADSLVRAGAGGPLSLQNQTLVGTLVFGTGAAPVAALHWLFPGAGAARIFVRPAAGASAVALRATLRRLFDASGLAATGATLGGIS